MDSSPFNLYKRVRLPDRREGFVEAMFSPGAPRGVKRPSDTLTVMTDDYVQVECWPWQATEVRRTRGQTTKSKDPKGSFYPVELDNEARLKMAIWHDHWDRFPPKDVERFFVSYWDAYSKGSKVPLPAREDIRAQAPTPPRKPGVERPRLF